MTNTLEEIQLQITKPKGRLLTVAHRGDLFNYPENSLLGFESCINMGIDIIEFDVHKTKDAELIVMHDLSVDRTTNGTGYISDLTLSEIKELHLKENFGGSETKLTNEKVPTLMEAMLKVKDKILVNLDQCWENRDEVYDVLQASNTVDHVIIKSNTSNNEVDSWLLHKKIKPYYSAICTNNNIDYLNDLLNGIKPEIFELIFDDNEDIVFSNNTLAKLKGNARIWVNTMWSELCGGTADDKSGWKILMDKGVNIIQTDNLKAIINYIKKLY